MRHSLKLDIRLIETDVAVAADTQHLDINAADFVQHGLVGGAGLIHIRRVAIRHMDIGLVNIDMVKQIHIHEVMIALVVLGSQGIILIQVVGADFGKVQKARLVKSDELLVGAHGGRTGGQTQHRIRLYIHDAGQNTCRLLAQGFIAVADQNLHVVSSAFAGVPFSAHKLFLLSQRY